jgi:spore coat protein A, manganese oxidase
MLAVKRGFAVLAVAFSAAVSAAPLPGGTLNPLSIPKYVDPLPIPGTMPETSPGYYEIAVRQIQQQVLSTGTVLTGNVAGTTTVWAYGSVNHPGTFRYPAPSIEAAVNTPVQVKWINQLVADPVACQASPTPATDPACNFLPHLFNVDQTLHWANPPAGDGKGSHCMPMAGMPGMCQQPYAGPVPTVVHLHGAHVDEDSDGYPTAWWLPAANDIPAGYAIQGAKYSSRVPAAPGAAVYHYRNDQRATTLWFHDHALGMTRNNVYAGPAGFYLLRGGADDLPSGVAGGLPGGAYEIPLVVQDRSFNADGSLFYAPGRAFFDGFAGPYIDDAFGRASDVAPIHNPEFFGNTMVVNGKTWPFLNVEPRKYRFRILNATDSRVLMLKASDKRLPFTQIGSDGGFLPAPVVLGQLLVAPAERADVIVDFAAFAPGSVVTLLNVGPDSPFGGPFAASLAADPATTGQVMQFKVVPLTAADTSAIPALPPVPALPAQATVRRVSLNELESSQVCVDGANLYVSGVSPPACGKRSAPLAPISARLGTIDPILGTGIPWMFADPITENPALGGTEIWEISNFTADAHPIHLHQVMFQVVNRQVIGNRKARPPEVWESGLKDTVLAYPGEITRIKAFYDLPGLYLWHCHILSHEDNDMMRPVCVGGGCTP